MASNGSKHKGGRPKRKEERKAIYIYKSTLNHWNQVKEYLGEVAGKAFTNNDLAVYLLSEVTKRIEQQQQNETEKTTAPTPSASSSSKSITRAIVTPCPTQHHLTKTSISQSEQGEQMFAPVGSHISF